MIGLVFLIIGIVWFMQSLGLIDSTIWGILLPLIMIAFGLKILNKHANGMRGCCMHHHFHGCCDDESGMKPVAKAAEAKASVVKKVVKSKSRK